MRDYYDLRENAIKECVEKCKKEIDLLKKNNDTPVSVLREKSFNMRLFQQELDIEQIHRERSYKAVEERCRAYF